MNAVVTQRLYMLNPVSNYLTPISSCRKLLPWQQRTSRPMSAWLPTWFGGINCLSWQHERRFRLSEYIHAEPSLAFCGFHPPVVSSWSAPSQSGTEQISSVLVPRFPLGQVLEGGAGKKLLYSTAHDFQGPSELLFCLLCCLTLTWNCWARLSEVGGAVVSPKCR